ncbi:MAG: hypothetical protein M1814_001553 [Vezdaea aestivalis]|nr:MAG: hypothetical protein M1814_001553 [Vezdaea aestivalis]
MAEPWNDELTEDWVPQPRDESDQSDFSEPETPGDEENETMSRIAVGTHPLASESVKSAPKETSASNNGPRKVSFSTQEFTEWTTQVMDRLRAEQQQQSELRDSELASHESSKLSTVEEAEAEVETEVESEHKTDSRRRISPQDMSHLLKKQVAGMVLDSEKHTWVPVDGEHDSDPLAGISDLSVDESIERARVIDRHHDGEHDPDSSSVPSKWSKLASSGPAPTTRATSWGDAPIEPVKRSAPPKKSFQVTVSTPITGRNASVLQSSILRRSHVSFNLTPMRSPSPLQSSPNQTLQTFHLSTLPDFTVRDLEETPREAPKLPLIRSNPSLATLVLVAALTDVEPYEPFWEAIEQLGLADRKLDSLERLEQFCPRIGDLDASKNHLSHVNGVPGRFLHRLNISSNRFTDLTAWTRLSNLHYVNVSDNHLESLDGFSCLMHLSHLVADGNKITSLEGILRSRSLVKLSVRHNKIKAVDFKGGRLGRLEELDLEANEIATCSNIHQLPSITTLILNNNNLTMINPSVPIPSIQTLKLNNNELSRLSITFFPDLRILLADSNALTTIDGLVTATHLDTVSLRSQSPLPLTPPTPILLAAYETRKLFLSHNTLPALPLTPPYLNLQTLDLSAVGLRALPTDFGSRFPNIRILDLRDNCISDLSPLRCGPLSLKRLDLSGNRITDAKAAFKALARFKHLTKLDLRANPITLGFYPREDEGAEEKGAFQARAEMEERVRMRMYDIMLWRGAKGLKLLDGRPFGKDDALRKDEVYDRLVTLEVLVPRI